MTIVSTGRELSMSGSGGGVVRSGSVSFLHEKDNRVVRIKIYQSFCFMFRMPIYNETAELSSVYQVQHLFGYFLRDHIVSDIFDVEFGVFAVGF